MLKFNITTTPEKYFHQLVEVLKVFAPFNELRKRERDVFGAMLYQLHLIEQNGGSEDQLFEYRSKQEIAASVGISKANLYNIYKELRQHELLTKDGINQKYKFKYLQHREIAFTFRGGTSKSKNVSN
jgi:hypothetical protein